MSSAGFRALPDEGDGASCPHQAGGRPRRSSFRSNQSSGWPRSWRSGDQRHLLFLGLQITSCMYNQIAPVGHLSKEYPLQAALAAQKAAGSSGAPSPAASSALPPRPPSRVGWQRHGYYLHKEHLRALQPGAAPKAPQPPKAANKNLKRMQSNRGYVGKLAHPEGFSVIAWIDASRMFHSVPSFLHVLHAEQGASGANAVQRRLQHGAPARGEAEGRKEGAVLAQVSLLDCNFCSAGRSAARAAC